ncbi:hypothetical protein WR30_07170 [Burkholderia contaminans FFH2055]|nr:hypothetical protein WR30_07170 [Burkholderia contaminans FFH2055]
MGGLPDLEAVPRRAWSRHPRRLTVVGILRARPGAVARLSSELNAHPSKPRPVRRRRHFARCLSCRPNAA